MSSQAAAGHVAAAAVELPHTQNNACTQGCCGIACHAKQHASGYVLAAAIESPHTQNNTRSLKCVAAIACHAKQAAAGTHIASAVALAIQKPSRCGPGPSCLHVIESCCSRWCSLLCQMTPRPKSYQAQDPQALAQLVGAMSTVKSALMVLGQYGQASALQHRSGLVLLSSLYNITQ